MFSCMLGARKPDPEAFRSGLALLKTSATNVFFIDDNVRNVDSARALGIRAEQATTAVEVEFALMAVGYLGSVPPSMG
ncbi:hypothetical protein B2J88_51605 [Rhodococcus sp. SRB_17]|nr:hypothetical protein [Rhodococcus sp. SRB_17]